MCERSHARQRMDLVRGLSSTFSGKLSDYWWLAAKPVIDDVRLSKMVMTMLESTNETHSSNEYSKCTLVLPIGCGARVPGQYVDGVVKLQDEFQSFPSEVTQSVLHWSVKIFDPLMLPSINNHNNGDDDLHKKPGDSKHLIRKPRNRHRRQTFGLSRSSSFLDNYMMDYMSDDSWVFENRLLMAASSGDGMTTEVPVQRADVFDVLTMVTTTERTRADDFGFGFENVASVRSTLVSSPLPISSTPTNEPYEITNDNDDRVETVDQEVIDYFSTPFFSLHDSMFFLIIFY